MASTSPEPAGVRVSRSHRDHASRQRQRHARHLRQYLGRGSSDSKRLNASTRPVSIVRAAVALLFARKTQIGSGAGGSGALSGRSVLSVCCGMSGTECGIKDGAIASVEVVAYQFPSVGSCRKERAKAGQGGEAWVRTEPGRPSLSRRSLRRTTLLKRDPYD